MTGRWRPLFPEDHAEIWGEFYHVDAILDYISEPDLERVVRAAQAAAVKQRASSSVPLSEWDCCISSIPKEKLPKKRVRGIAKAWVAKRLVAITRRFRPFSVSQRVVPEHSLTTPAPKFDLHACHTPTSAEPEPDDDCSKMPYKHRLAYMAGDWSTLRGVDDLDVWSRQVGPSGFSELLSPLQLHRNEADGSSFGSGSNSDADRSPEPPAQPKKTLRFAEQLISLEVEPPEDLEAVDGHKETTESNEPYRHERRHDTGRYANDGHDEAEDSDTFGDSDSEEAAQTELDRITTHNTRMNASSNGSTKAGTLCAAMLKHV